MGSPSPAPTKPSSSCCHLTWKSFLSVSAVLTCQHPSPCSLFSNRSTCFIFIEQNVGERINSGADAR